MVDSTLSTKVIVLIFFLLLASIGNIIVSIYILTNIYSVNSLIDDRNKLDAEKKLDYVKYVSIIYLVGFIITLIILFISLYYQK